MKIGEFLKEHTLLCDGAMGTYYAAKFHNETLVERENFEHPERIAQIHGEYLDGGARLLRTNTLLPIQTSLILSRRWKTIL